MVGMSRSCRDMLIVENFASMTIPPVVGKQEVRGEAVDAGIGRSRLRCRSNKDLRRISDFARCKASICLLAQVLIFQAVASQRRQFPRWPGAWGNNPIFFSHLAGWSWGKTFWRPLAPKAQKDLRQANRLSQ